MRNDKVLNKLLSHVMLPAPEVEIPIMPNFKISKNRTRKPSPEKMIYQPFKREKSSKPQRRNLMNHSQFSVANLKIKESFEKIMKNQK